MAVIKVGNNTIGKISVIEPYDDPIGLVEEPEPIWTRPDYWLDMPVINSGEDKCAFLFAVPSGTNGTNDSLLNYFAIKLYGGLISSNQYNTDFTIDWGDGNSDSINQYGGFLPNPIEHEFDFYSLPESTQFTDNGTIYRQSLITVEANSGVANFDFKYRKYHGSWSRNVSKLNVLEYNINLPTATEVTANHYNGFHMDMHLLKKAKVYAPNVIHFNALFDGSWNLEELDIYSGVMPNLTGVNFMFSRCGVKELPKLDTSNVVDCKYMFQRMQNVKSLPSGLYDFGSITGCQNTFQRSSFEDVHFDIPSTVTRCESLFNTCLKIKKISGNWDTSNCWYMTSMFTDCYKLVYLPDLDFSVAQDINYIFSNCYNLRKLPDVILPVCTTARSSFSNCRSVEEITIDLSNPNDNNIRYENLFFNCSSLKKVNMLSNKIYTQNTTGAQSMFGECKSLRHMPYVDLSGVTNVHGFYSNCTNLNIIDGLNAPRATNTDYIFDGCVSLEKIKTLNIASEATSLTRGLRAFRNCRSLKEFPQGINLANFYLAQDFFSNLNCSGEIDIDFSGCITANNPGSTNWFANMNWGRTPLVVKNLSIPSGAKLDTMFYSNGNLVSIPYVDASNMDSCSQMFNYATALEQGALSGVAKSIGYYRCPLSSGAVIDIINGLASGVVGQTIDLRQVPGAYAISSEEIAIAENKGWTVST